jgi:hypothetical protein
MFDQRHLVDAITRSQGTLALALILEGSPTFEDVHHLKAAVMHVPFVDLVIRLHSFGTNHMCHVIAIRAGRDAKVAIFKYGAHTLRPVSIASLVVHKLPRFIDITLTHMAPRAYIREAKTAPL